MCLARCCVNCAYREEDYCYLKNKETKDDDGCQRWLLKGEPLPFTDPMPDNYISDGDGWE